MSRPIPISKKYKHKVRDDYIPTFDRPIKITKEFPVPVITVCEAKGVTVLLSLGTLVDKWDEVTCIHCMKIRALHRLSY